MSDVTLYMVQHIEKLFAPYDIDMFLVSCRLISLVVNLWVYPEGV